MTGDLVLHLTRFAGALRQRGSEIGVGDEVDAARALLLVDLSDRDEVRRALRIAFKVHHRDWAAFDELFARFWIPSPAIDNPPVGEARAGSGPGQPNVSRAAETFVTRDPSSD